MGFFTGEKPSYRYVSNLSKEQQPFLSDLLYALQNRGAGGAWGPLADYYQNLMNISPEEFQKFSAPYQREFREQTIPGLAEQFAGMGAGGLSSSGFRNAAVSAGTDLSERLAALREQVRMQGAQGLQGLNQLGLGQYGQTVMEQGSPGFLEQFAPAIGAGIGSIFGTSGPLSNFFKPSTKGKASPYGGQASSAAIQGGASIFGK